MPCSGRRLKAYYICTTELFLGDVEHVGKLIPHHDISLDEDYARLARVFIDEFLRFRTQGKIGNHDIAVLLEQQLCERVVDTC
jgi:hypothetical protein